MAALDQDMKVRLAAIAWLKQQAQLPQHRNGLPRSPLLEKGFVYNPELETGEPPATYAPGVREKDRVSLMAQYGIFKPRQCDYPLTITTTVNAPYDDHLDEDTGLLRYRYYDLSHRWAERHNAGLRALMLLKRPLIYLRALAPGRYVHMPVWVFEDDPEKRELGIAIGSEAQALATNHDPETTRVQDRRQSYVVRLEQPRFRTRVLKAYRHRCSLCRLGHETLLEAAHIKPHSEEGPAIVSNGIAMCRLHHGAYDANLLGIDPDRRIFIPERLRKEKDGPTLKHSIQGLHREPIEVPRLLDNRPRQDWLEQRWERFLQHNP